MGVILDAGLSMKNVLRKALMAGEQSVAVLWQDEEQGRTALLAKAPDEEVESFGGEVLIQTGWELGRFGCGSVLRLRVAIFDRPGNPYRFEIFINVAAAEQLACVMGLVSQEGLPLHFFDSRTRHVLTKEIRNRVQQRRQLRQLVNLAVQDRADLGSEGDSSPSAGVSSPEGWDFEQAKALFQATRPL